MGEVQHFMVDIEAKLIRLDHFLTSVLTGFSRSSIIGLIKNGLVQVEQGTITKPGFFVRKGSDVCVTLFAKETPNFTRADIPLDIVYEDDDLMVVNKPKDLVVHPARGHREGTLVNALMSHLDLTQFAQPGDRPGIVHRIDKDTSGLLLIAKNDFALTALQAQLKEHQIEREYLALVHGVIKGKTINIDAPIGRDPQDRLKMSVGGIEAKEAITHAVVLHRFSKYTLLRISLETGRTHQIRVHFHQIGFPLVGDPTYGLSDDQYLEYGQFLHAFRLKFTHPRTNKLMIVYAKVPQYLRNFLANL